MLGPETLPRAAWRGDLEAVRRHLEQGAHVDETDRGGWTALMRAADRGDEEMVAELLARGADPNLKRPSGRTAIFSACLRGPLAVVQRLLNAGADFTRPDDCCGRLPLEGAAECGRADIVGLVTRTPGNPSDPFFYSLVRAVGRAVIGGKLRVLRALLESGRHPRLLFAPTYFLNGDNVVMATVRTGSAERLGLILEFLQEGDFSHAGYPIGIALEMGRPDLVQMLTSAGLPFEIEDAVYSGQVELLRAFLDSGASPESHVRGSNDNLLELAAALGKVEVIDELVRRGAHVNRGYLAYTPLMSAICAKQWAAMERLLALGANPMLPTRHTNAFEAACGYAPLEILERLIAAGANANSPAGLRSAAAFGRIDVVRFLLDHGTGPNKTAPETRSPLAEAALRGYEEIVKLLLERGAERQLGSGHGRKLTAAEWATLAGRKRMVRLLDERT